MGIHVGRIEFDRSGVVRERTLMVIDRHYRLPAQVEQRRHVPLQDDGSRIVGNRLAVVAVAVFRNRAITVSPVIVRPHPDECGKIRTFAFLSG
jgi:hypothetical protein